MKIDTQKLDLLLARRGWNRSDLRGTSPQTIKRIGKGADLRPKTVGSIARQLEVDPIDIIEEV